MKLGGELCIGKREDARARASAEIKRAEDRRLDLNAKISNEFRISVIWRNVKKMLFACVGHEARIQTSSSSASVVGEHYGIFSVGTFVYV